MLTEFLGAASNHRVRSAACRMVLRLQGSRQTQIIAATRSGWLQAFNRFESRPDKDWLVDCSSMLICEELEIQSVFTHDRHFVQAGLRVLL